MSISYPQPGSPNSTPGEYNNPASTANTGATNIIGPAPQATTGVNPTSTSDVTGWMPDILTIIQEACERAAADFTTAYAIRSAKRSLDYLAMDWANKGLNLWTLDEIVTPLTSGVAGPYLMPIDTMDLIAPAIRKPQGNQTIELIIARQDFDTYFSIPNKANPGQPNIVFVRRISPQPQFYVWPTPNQTYFNLSWWRMRRMQNTGYATNGMDVPFRFIPALTAGLAWQLATKKKVKDYNLITELKNQYNEMFRDAQMEDRDRSSIYLAPYCAYGYGRRG